MSRTARRLRPAGKTPAADHVGPEHANGPVDQALISELGQVVRPDKVLWHVSDLVRYAADASPYRMIPSAVVIAEDIGDVTAVLRYAARAGRSVVFRGSGTSLSGQAQTDDILLDVRRNWRGFKILDDGHLVHARPGATIGEINAALKRHGRVLGPDPASSAVASVGGVVANNASGMAAGTRFSSYMTVRALTFVLPGGAVIDTAAPGAEQQFRAAAPELAEGLTRLRGEILADPALASRIQAKYSIKNTNGYRLIALTDADTPLEIFRRLLVGSEGTLGFLVEVVFETVPLGAVHSTALLTFPSIESAAQAVPLFTGLGARAVELMDASTLRLSAGDPRAPRSWERLPADAAALLVELRASGEQELAALRSAADGAVAGLSLWEPAAFTSDDALARFYWKVREGLMAGLGSSRAPGTTLIVEDVCVQPADIARAARDLLSLLARHGYPQGVAGHASAGNLHFVLSLDASSPGDRDRYARFMGDLVSLIAGSYDGSLKAEHGTGRNMAPFVEEEWGPRLTGMMWRIKELADPRGVLAPGVMLNRDRGANLRHLKSMPVIETTADACFECGFCEDACPSQSLTTTPRQRIALRREMTRQPAGSKVQDALLDRYQYDAVQTCAGDSGCASACPVGIDTGTLMRQFRTSMHGPAGEFAGAAVARHWAAAERLGRLGLAVGGRAGDTIMRRLTSALRAAAGDEAMPAWISALPAPAPRLPRTPRPGAAAVYFPACINRIFGPSRHSAGPLPLPQALAEVSARADLPVWVPDDVAGTCCATVWHSKGYTRGNRLMAARLADRLWDWSGGGRLPVVIDAASCTLGASREVIPYLDDHRRERHAQVKVLDSATWLARHVLPRVTVTRPAESASVHATCSTIRLGTGADLLAVASRAATRVFVPEPTACCGFAGDRGLLHPELTASATRREAAQVRDAKTAWHVSANRTCEIGLEQATGHEWTSVVQLAEVATRPLPPDHPAR